MDEDVPHITGNLVLEQLPPALGTCGGGFLVAGVLPSFSAPMDLICYVLYPLLHSSLTEAKRLGRSASTILLPVS